MSSTFVLVHSPIVGADTWEPVAVALRAAGHRTLVPVLDDDGVAPFFAQHVTAVVDAVLDADVGDPLTVVGHSGAGPLLDLIGAALVRAGHCIAALLFVDAGAPADGMSRLAQLRAEAPDLATDLERRFGEGRAFPDWTDEQLAGLVPDDDRRRDLLAGVHPQPSAFWTESIPLPTPRPDAPRGLVLLSDSYGRTAQVAAAEGWVVRDLAVGNHFHLLAAPDEVADALCDLDATLAGQEAGPT